MFGDVLENCHGYIIKKYEENEIAVSDGYHKKSTTKNEDKNRSMTRCTQFVL